MAEAANKVHDTVYRNGKLAALSDAEGTSLLAMLANVSFDSVAPSICMNEGCDYTTETEPDQREGWCEECETNTVQSCLVVAGII